MNYGYKYIWLQLHYNSWFGSVA